MTTAKTGREHQITAQPVTPQRTRGAGGRCSPQAFPRYTLGYFALYELVTAQGDGHSQQHDWTRLPGRGGRRRFAGREAPHLLKLNNELGYVVGVDIGATSVDLALADLNAQVLLRSTAAADVRGEPSPLLGEVKRRVFEMLRRQGLRPEQVVGVGVGVPGPVDFAHATLVAPPLMPAWENFPIRDFLTIFSRTQWCLLTTT